MNFKSDVVSLISCYIGPARDRLQRVVGILWKWRRDITGIVIHYQKEGANSNFLPQFINCSASCQMKSGEKLPLHLWGGKVILSHFLRLGSVWKTEWYIYLFRLPCFSRHFIRGETKKINYYFKILDPIQFKTIHENISVGSNYSEISVKTASQWNWEQIKVTIK